jgi:acetoin utilization protein AcuB
MLVRDRMQREVVTVCETDTLAHAATLLARRGIRHLPVRRGERLVGIVTDRDLRSAMPSSLTDATPQATAALLESTPVSAIMVREVITIAPDVPLEEAARLLTLRRIGCLPVVEGERLAGIITESDILRAFTQLLGVLEPSSRLELEIPNRPGALLALLTLLAERHGVNITSALLSPEPGGAPQRLVLRMATMNLAPLVITARDAGYRVIWPPVESWMAGSSGR